MDVDASVEEDGRPIFAVELDVFSGPFSVLLSLIARKRLDVTEVALAEVTDEFIAFIRSRDEFDLSEASEFLVVAATLLDLKASRLLPRGESDDEDLELLEQRDLLFAKLLQYRAFKQAAEDMGRRLAAQSLSFARNVPLEDRYAAAPPRTRIAVGRGDFARLAAIAIARKKDEEDEEVAIGHLHHPLVSVSSQIDLLRERLTPERVTFAFLCGDAENVATVVARFLALLHMLLSGEIDVEQDEALGSLVVIGGAGNGRGSRGGEAARAGGMPGGGRGWRGPSNAAAEDDGEAGGE